jgi:tetratricopeptide (TPR) repeat protein
MTLFKPFPEVIAQLHREHRTGILEFEEENHHYRIHLDRGSVVAVESDRPEQMLSQRLMDSGVVAPWDVELAFALTQKTRGKKLGQVLVEMGILQKEALIQELNKKLKDSFTALFDLGRINYAFTEDQGAPAPWTIVPTYTSADLILDGCRNMKSLLPATRMLQDPEAYLSISSDAKMTYQKARLTETEKMVLHHLREARKIQVLLNLIPQDRLEVLKAIYGLIISGFLNVSKEKPPVPAVEALPEPELPVPVTRREVVEKFSQIGTVTHYAILDLASNAQTRAIEEGFKRVAAKFHPDHATNESLSDLKHQLDSIFLAAVKARNVLMDSRQRKEYDEELVRHKSGKYDSTQVRMSSAGTHYQYAMKALGSGSPQDAIRSLLVAIENDPSNALYPFKMAQILKRLPTQQKEAEMYYKRALEMDPLNTDIMLELARLYTRNTMKSKAEAMYRHALGLDPSNPEVREEYDKVTRVFTFPLWEVASFLFGVLACIVVYEFLLK